MAYYIDTLLKKPYSGSKASIVIGIDVGTTFSGVSYAMLYPGVRPIIRSVTRFSQQDVGDSKVSSIIYYDTKDDRAAKAIGAAAKDPMITRQVKKKGWFEAKHFKLHLRPPTHDLETNGMHLGELPPEKTREQVMGDFLNYLVQETFRCTEVSEELKKEAEFVICHPNGWKGYSQRLYRKSAEICGIDAKQITFVAEGEASALACLWGRVYSSDNLSCGFRFVICDAGGGTVDTTTFEVVGTSPLQIKECAVPSCRFGGGEFVTMNGKRLLTDKLTGSKCEGMIDRLTETFDSNAKQYFTGDNDIALDLGFDVEDDESLGIECDALVLRRDEVATCFRDSISEIAESIHEQLSWSGSDEKKTPIWLTGGFGKSQYLQKELRRRFANVQIPDTSLAKAAANGSILHYIDKVVVARSCHTTYGTTCHIRFDSDNRDHRDRIDLVDLDRDGLFIGPVFDPIVEKGKTIPVGKTFSETYHRTPLSRESARLKADILCYDGDVPPPLWYNENKDKFRKLFELEADLSSLWDSVEAAPLHDHSLLGLLFRSIIPPYKDLVFEVEFEFGGTEDKARVKWGENGEIKYGPAKLIPQE